MKTIIWALIIPLLAQVSSLADQKAPKPIQKLEINDEVYEDVTLTDVRENEVSISHEAGVATIPLANLSKQQIEALNATTTSKRIAPDWNKKLQAAAAGAPTEKTTPGSQISRLTEQNQDENTTPKLTRKRFGDLFGYVNSEGVVVFKPVFLYAGEFKNGLAKVWSKEGYGYMDTAGNFVDKDPEGDRPEKGELAEQIHAGQIVTDTSDTDVEHSIKNFETIDLTNFGKPGEHPSLSEAQGMLLIGMENATFRLKGTTPHVAEKASETKTSADNQFPTESEVLTAVLANEANKDDVDALSVLVHATEAPNGTYRETTVAMAQCIVGSSYATGYLLEKNVIKGRKLLIEAKEHGSEKTQLAAETMLKMLDTLSK